MYEKTGLGWSEPSWDWNWDLLLFGPGEHWGKCDVEYDELTREVCFEPGEESIARANGCEQRIPVIGNKIDCTTTSGNEGALWCCRPGYPREYYEQSVVTPSEPGVEIPSLPPIPEFTAPVAKPASFFTKLLHPGSLLAIGLFSVAGVLVYRRWKDEL
jgi:hypothetical protein